MDSLVRTRHPFEVQALVHAIARNHGPDAFQPAFNARQWEMLGTYLQPSMLQPGEVLIEQQSTSRTVYFVQSGTLTVHYADDRGHIRLAAVGPGSAVGEGAFFSHQPRGATVQAGNGPCTVWALSPARFAGIASRQPAMALEIALALGALALRRLANRQKRVAVT